MSQTNVELCREIARLDPEWYRELPGVAVRDPDGDLWRRIAGGWIRERNLGIVLDGWSHDWATKPLHSAIAAGPDWTDLVTVNALLGDGQVWRQTYAVEIWFAAVPGGRPVVVVKQHPPDRTTAILLAKVASLGG